MTYQLTQQGSISLLIDDRTTLHLPSQDNGTPEWAAYKAWLSEGNTPEPAPEPEVTWDSIRAKRDQIIRDTDWTMTPGATVDQGAWASYRQILRDLPQTFAKTGPESVIWPTEPSTAGPNSTPVE